MRPPKQWLLFLVAEQLGSILGFENKKKEEQLGTVEARSPLVQALSPLVQALTKKGLLLVKWWIRNKKGVVGPLDSTIEEKKVDNQSPWGTLQLRIPLVLELYFDIWAFEPRNFFWPISWYYWRSC